MILSTEVLFMGIFIICIVAILLADLLLIGKNSHEVSLKEATWWSIVWITLALLFALFLRFFGEMVHGIETMEHLTEVVQKYSPELKLNGATFAENIEIFRKFMTINYLTGYLIEETLSIDNLFVMLMILTAFSVRHEDYKPVLFWGILGAIVMRFLFIFIGAALIQKFAWILYIFGAYLVYTGVMMYIKRHSEEKIDTAKHPLVKFLSRFFKVYPKYVGHHFFIKKGNVRYITPLFVVLILIEFSDLIFATDSIPAIFAVTVDPYVVFFSNIFAILGLRSLFFLLVHIVKMFYYLKTGIAVLLVFIGFKLLFHSWLEAIGFETVYSLYIILIIIGSSIGFSLLRKGRLSELPVED